MRFSVDEHREWFNNQPRKPVSAAVLLVNESGKILLLKPTYRDDWNLPGGVVEASESPLDGAIREAKEELGITLTRQQLRLSTVDYRPVKNELVDKLYFYFHGGTLSQQQVDSITLEQSEIEEMRFATLDEAKRLLSKWTHRQVSVSLSEQSSRATYLENGMAPEEGN